MYQEGKALAAFYPGHFSGLCLQQATVRDAVVSPQGKKSMPISAYYKNSQFPKAQSSFPISQPSVRTGGHDRPFAKYHQRCSTALRNFRGNVIKYLQILHVHALSQSNFTSSNLSYKIYKIVIHVPENIDVLIAAIFVIAQINMQTSSRHFKCSTTLFTF